MGEETAGEEEMNNTEAELKSLQLSLYSITRITSKKSIKVWGELAGRKVIVLIDCGASHNFISSVLVEEEAIEVTETVPYTVEVWDGRKIRCAGVCPKLSLQIQGLEVQQDFYIFELGEVDIVLRMEWLAGLGEIRANFQELTLKVPTSKGIHVLRGDPALARAAASFISVMKAIQAEGQGFIVDYLGMQATSGKESIETQWLKGALDSYEEVFKEPQGLPPSRRNDHAIVLKEGTDIPNLRPYRYLHYQKTEIEKLVNDLLRSGV